jgi:glyoxylase-like metal-dependent hydrolase (beta-lactamase superfamily II)
VSYLAAMSESASPIGAAILPVTPLQQNCTIVWCTATMRGAIIDPGGEVDRLLQAAAVKGVTLEKIWITHGHLDHAGGAHELQQRTGLPIEGPHPDDEFWIEGISAQGLLYGMPEAKSFVTGRWLADGDRVQVGEAEFEVYHCPGHTPGHVVFFHRTARFAQVGDVLFKDSIGRWDFPRGDEQDLIRSITTKLWPLGDDVVFVPGHGPTSTFGAERRNNPYVSDRVLAERST